MASHPTASRFDRAEPIADAVLWEGYVLYPYRASSAKNRLRFNWGVVGPAEEPTLAVTVLVSDAATTIDVRVRHLHLVVRSDGWDEAVPVTHGRSVTLQDLVAGPVEHPLVVEPSIAVDGDGLTRQRHAIDATLELCAQEHGRHVAVRAEVGNPAPCPDGDRTAALRSSLIGCHVLLATDGDHFVSLLEPPDELAELAASLEQHRAWPVLVGPPPARDLVLGSPVILYDYPTVAPESAGEFHDGTEIDEMLALRVHALTDEEKVEARALDPKSRAIIDRHDELDPEVMARLHGTRRPADLAATKPVDPHPEWSDPGPDRALVGGTWIRPGSKVRLQPTGRADVHDMFLIGRRATVADVVHDVDGGIHVAVTVDDDPAAEFLELQRRFLYFAPDDLVAEPDSAEVDSAEVDSADRGEEHSRG